MGPLPQDRALTARRDELFELADAALCADGAVKSPMDLTLLPKHRREHGAMYGGLNHGRIDVGRLRAVPAGLSLPRFDGGRLAGADARCRRPADRQVRRRWRELRAPPERRRSARGGVVVGDPLHHESDRTGQRIGRSRAHDVGQLVRLALGDGHHAPERVEARGIRRLVGGSPHGQGAVRLGDDQSAHLPERVVIPLLSGHHAPARHVHLPQGVKELAQACPPPRQRCRAVRGPPAPVSSAERTGSPRRDQVRTTRPGRRRPSGRCRHSERGNSRCPACVFRTRRPGVH
ncbi:transposase [Streptomyces nodosus]|uniref:transposase n=1 Tax=Streptomyces nodosus TaxID=40318 RepID=UPI00387F6805